MLADTLKPGQLFRVGKLPQSVRHYVVIKKFKTTIHIVCLQKDPMKIEIHKNKDFEIHTHQEYHFHVLSFKEVYSVISDIIDVKVNRIAEVCVIFREQRERIPLKITTKQRKLEGLKRKILSNLYQVGQSFFIKDYCYKIIKKSDNIITIINHTLTKKKDLNGSWLYNMSVDISDENQFDQLCAAHIEEEIKNNPSHVKRLQKLFAQYCSNIISSPTGEK